MNLLAHIDVPANWFADGQHILVLGGGAIYLATQAVTFWRQNITNRKVSALNDLIQVNDKEILDELTVAQKALNKVVDAVAGRPASDRRRPGSAPSAIYASGVERRAGDPGTGGTSIMPST